MTWKPREKALTPEEAMALAKKELAPFWFNGQPLLAGVRVEDRFSAHALSPDFSEKNWLIFFVDLMSLHAEKSWIYAKEFYRRYLPHDVHVLVVLRTRFVQIPSLETLPQLIKNLQLTFPLVLDHDYLLARSLGVTAYPSVLFLERERLTLSCAGDASLVDFETSLQSSLRKVDRGLSLFPVFRSETKWIHEDRALDFGVGKGTHFSGGQFKISDTGYGEGAFSHGTLPPLLATGEVHLGGRWLQDQERIATSDPLASLSFKLESTHASLVAQSLGKTIEPAKILLELNGAPLPENLSGADIFSDDEGHTSIRVDSGRLYRLGQKIAAPGVFNLKFPFADRVPVALYGLRLGS